MLGGEIIMIVMPYWNHLSEIKWKMVILKNVIHF